MKRPASLVWKFFERILEDGRCVTVVCKLCECHYKFFGNTTNLRVHLTNRHTKSWEMALNDKDSSFTLEDAIKEEANNTLPPVRRRRSKVNKNKRRKTSVESISEIPLNSDTDAEEKSTIDLVRQMHGEQASDEEWLDEDPFQVSHYETYEAKPTIRGRKYIKRELRSPNGLPGYYTVPTERLSYEDKDEFSVFGEYVANKIRKIKTARTRGNLQQLITTILWQADYGVYDSAENVRKVLMMNLENAEETQAQNEQFDLDSHAVQTEEIVLETNVGGEEQQSEISESLINVNVN